jgi:uncharacterized protein YyaL (SSP411 family)
MKLFIAFILLALPIQWEPNFENAKKTAKEKHELILLNFSDPTGVDSCILFRRDYLENEAFGQMAADHLVLVNADFPRKKKNTGSPDVVARNKALAEIYNKEGSFPLTLLLDADGKVIKTWHGKPDAPVAQWTAEIKAICDARK